MTTDPMPRALPPAAGGVHASPGAGHHWRRDAVELAAMFTAVLLADLVAKLVIRGSGGPMLLLGAVAALLGSSALHVWWAHRRRRVSTHSPPRTAARAAGRAAGRRTGADPATRGAGTGKAPAATECASCARSLGGGRVAP
ncbi:hypothetical protein [Allostreptomyces psammosilenae]|uniref:Uncharacterized protein n=1 Tax=Allostreptomyces psammosilenae TaxID=1892865 RepID=A0A852ZYH2_9ACTN|nr:hypothetical protein [Allostreptomyces psammosilenae]NYI07115.1 hypothetical protein [Allostreptomyces psammosilenae]